MIGQSQHYNLLLQLNYSLVIPIQISRNNVVRYKNVTHCQSIKQYTVKDIDTNINGVIYK